MNSGKNSALHGLSTDAGHISGNSGARQSDGSLEHYIWLPACNPFHNRSLPPSVNRKPSISTGYQRSGGSRRTGSDVNVDFPITLHDANVASRVVSLSQVMSQDCRKNQPLSACRLVTQFVTHFIRRYPISALPFFLTIWAFSSSIIRAPMGSGVLVDPIFLGVGHALATRNFPRGSGPVKGAAFRAVAEGFEPVLLF